MVEGIGNIELPDGKLASNVLPVVLDVDEKLKSDDEMIENIKGKRKNNKIEEFNELTDQGEILYDSMTKLVDDIEHNYSNGKLILQPSFQRKYRWSKDKACRLIESILMKFPLPLIYYAEEDKGNFSVIDGQQRLTSIISYKKGIFPGEESTPFVLEGMSPAYKHLNGKSFNELDDGYKEKINNYGMKIIVLKKNNDSHMKYELFTRLNMNSMTLNSMELRNCLYRGEYMKLLYELSEDKTFNKIACFSDNERKTMSNIEGVLRFSAFYHRKHKDWNKPGMSRFLNHDMETYQNITEVDKKELTGVFNTAVSNLYRIFGTNDGRGVFRKHNMGSGKINKLGKTSVNGKWSHGGSNVNMALLDAIMNVFCDIPFNNLSRYSDLIRESIIDLESTNTEFIKSIGVSNFGNQTEHTRNRHAIMKNLITGIVGDENKQKRCFSYKLKKEVFDKDSSCEICGQDIKEIDDAHLDHYLEFRNGGKTVDENARLTHRYCNLTRSR
jgi:hypothetical protein